MITCKRCGEDKAPDDMIVRAGKPSKLCRVCFAASFADHGGIARGGRPVKSRDTKPEPVASPAQPGMILALEIARGYGFRAAAEDGVLVIEQDADDGTATIVLSRTEFKVLAAQFAEWAA